MAKIETLRLFNKASRDQEHANDYKIIIDNSIEGFITNEFTVDASAQWEPVFSIPDAFAVVENAMNAGGVSVFKSGFFTRKFYKGGSYLEFAVDFRVVDWDGGQKTDIVAITNQLLDYTAPAQPSFEHLQAVIDESKVIAGTLGTDGLAAITGDASAGKALYDNLKESGERLSNLGGQEIPVAIGQYWSGSLVIESVNAKYSRERTARGPLYADYSIKFSKREILAKGEDKGFKQLTSRVTQS